MTVWSPFCLYLADNKQFLGIRLSEWCVSAPSLEASIAATAMAQDELGHTRVLHGILSELPDDPLAGRDPEDASAYRVVPILGSRLETWEDLIASVLLVDGFLMRLVALGIASGYTLFSARMKKVYEEERFHRLYAEGWAKWMGQSGGGAESLRGAISRTYGVLAAHWETQILPEIREKGEPRIGGVESALREFVDSLDAPLRPAPMAARIVLSPVTPDVETMRLISGYYRRVYGVG
ncbi:MAG: Phenylacetic acid catabolic protein [bacterium JZ-2024 1]